MDRGNTKREILNASLDLFSTQGFEATSISQIADRVGIRKASLYSHFESKQAILDALVKDILEKYSQHSVLQKQIILPMWVLTIYSRPIKWLKW
jgi:AcrR family transcriptional regulator